MREPYRIKVENGKITITIWDPGKKDPIISVKGNLKSPQIKSTIKFIEDKYGSYNPQTAYLRFCYTVDKLMGWS